MTHFDPQNLTALIIGTGFSGICMGIKLKEQGIDNFILLEKASEVGGTWRENTYPGAECDIPSALYSYSFEPYPYWEYKWSHQPQILEYLKFVVKKYDLRKHIHFQKEMTAAHWLDKQKQWNVKTKDGTTYQTQSLITAIGQLHHPSTPNFIGKEDFAGAHFHSAQWDHTVNLKGKVVGVIGNAASAIQFIPEIAKAAKKVLIFQRSANWMLPKQDRLYKKWEKDLVARFPILLKLYRLRLWLLGGALFLLLKKGNRPLRKFYEWQTKRYIKQHIKDSVLIEKLIPKYPLGAKRVLFSDNYYEALSHTHVQLTDIAIDKITATGIQTKDQQAHPLDVLIFATGFKTNPFLLNLDIRGKKGLNIKTAWQEGPKSYLGMTTTHFPNLFMMYGPNTNLGHNSIIIMSEAQSGYIAQCIAGMQKNNWSELEIKETIVQSHYQSIQRRLKNMIWTEVKQSWYQTANGNIPNNWPGRTMEYIRLTKHVDFSLFKKK